MGSISGEFLASGRRFSWSGHQCWFASEPMAALGWLITGHFGAGVPPSAMGAAEPATSLLMVVPHLTHAADGSGRLPSCRLAAVWQAGRAPVDDLGLVDDELAMSSTAKPNPPAITPCR